MTSTTYKLTFYLCFLFPDIMGYLFVSSHKLDKLD